jgi:hypothetical protein
MSKIAIIVSAGPEGEDFISYLDLTGFFPVCAPPTHRYASIRGPFRLVLVDGTAAQVELAAECHGKGAQFDLTRVGTGPEAPAASVIFDPK